MKLKQLFFCSALSFDPQYFFLLCLFMSSHMTMSIVRYMSVVAHTTMPSSISLPTSAEPGQEYHELKSMQCMLYCTRYCMSVGLDCPLLNNHYRLNDKLVTLYRRVGKGVKSDRQQLCTVNLVCTLRWTKFGKQLSWLTLCGLFF